jgi:hypothetical protein
MAIYQGDCSQESEIMNPAFEIVIPETLSYQYVE